METEPKICRECDDRPYPTECDPWPDCGCEPRECALAKACWVKRLKREAAEKGVTVGELAAQYRAKEDALIAEQYRQMAEFMAAELDREAAGE